MKDLLNYLIKQANIIIIMSKREKNAFIIKRFSSK